MTTRALSYSTLTAILLLAPSCNREQPEQPLAEKSKSLEAPEPKSPESVELTVDSSTADVSFEMQAPLERQDGEVPSEAVDGHIDVDLTDLTKSTGLVHVDISDMVIYQQKREDQDTEYGERKKSELQNEHMRDWLEIGDDAPEEEREKNTHVEFKLMDIEDPSVKNINEMEGNERKVTFTAVGEFRMHQRKASKEVPMKAVFHYEGGKPTSVEVSTVQPFEVDLDEHDVRPRTGFGQLAQKTLQAMSPKVAEKSKVHVEFTAKPK